MKDIRFPLLENRQLLELAKKRYYLMENGRKEEFAC